EYGEGCFESFAVAEGLAGGVDQASESPDDRGVHVGAAGSEEVTAGFGEGLLENGQLAPVADGAFGDPCSGRSLIVRVSGSNGDHGEALGAIELIESRDVGHRLQSERPARRAGLSDC